MNVLSLLLCLVHFSSSFAEPKISAVIEIYSAPGFVKRWTLDLNGIELPPISSIQPASNRFSDKEHSAQTFLSKIDQDPLGIRDRMAKRRRAGLTSVHAILSPAPNSTHALVIDNGACNIINEKGLPLHRATVVGDVQPASLASASWSQGGDRVVVCTSDQIFTLGLSGDVKKFAAFAVPLATYQAADGKTLTLIGYREKLTFSNIKSLIAAASGHPQSKKDFYVWKISLESGQLIGKVNTVISNSEETKGTSYFVETHIEPRQAEPATQAVP